MIVGFKHLLYVTAFARHALVHHKLLLEFLQSLSHQCNGIGEF